MATKRQKEIRDILAATYQGATTELIYRTPFQLLIATMMAAQSTDVQVNKVTAQLFKDYGTARAMASLSARELAEKIKTVGLYRNKSKNMQATAQIITADLGGKVPQTLEGLTALPGVGRKTANVVLSNAFDIPAFAVDTHVFRTARRLGLSRKKTPEGVEEDLMRVFDESEWKDAHHWLIYHGRRTCPARRPKCPICPLSHICRSKDKVTD